MYEKIRMVNYQDVKIFYMFSSLDTISECKPLMDKQSYVAYISLAYNVLQWKNIPF